MKKTILVLLFSPFFWLGCTTLPTARMIDHRDSCPEQLAQVKTKSFEIQMNSISVLFSRECYSEVVSLGTEIRKKNRDKYYSLRNEAKELVLNEGTGTDYTLDSHERIFLSILIAESYYRKNDLKASEIELGKAYEESIAEIHSSGTDEVNVLLQGLMWLRLKGWNKAEPFFKKIETTADYSEHLKIFVENLKINLRTNKGTRQIRVSTMNHLPKITFDWFQTYSKSYEPKVSIKNCIADGSLILTTRPWISQIEHREDFEHDPVLAAKRALRLPAATISAAAVLFVGGGLTYAVLSAGSSAGQLAGVLGALTGYFTYRTFVNGLAPDMRYWNEMPEAIYIEATQEKNAESPCLKKYALGGYDINKFIEFDAPLEQ